MSQSSAHEVGELGVRLAAAGAPCVRWHKVVNPVTTVRADYRVLGNASRVGIALALAVLWLVSPGAVSALLCTVALCTWMWLLNAVVGLSSLLAASCATITCVTMLMHDVGTPALHAVLGRRLTGPAQLWVWLALSISALGLAWLLVQVVGLPIGIQLVGVAMRVCAFPLRCACYFVGYFV